MNPQIDPQQDTRPKTCSERIDRLCLEFEDAWQAGGTPEIATYLQGWTGVERACLLRELLLLEVAYLRRRGCLPTADEYAAKFPDDGPIVAELFGTRDVTSPVEMAAGEVVGRYVVERRLGSGSFGQVYLAWDGELGRMVAIKMPRLSGSNDALRLDDFIEEARTASRIDHPALVPVLDVVHHTSGLPVMVMPFIDGPSLRDRMAEGPLTRSEAVALLIDIADAIDFAHRRGFVHRDLKPRNILLDGDGRPHITDFGLALHESKQYARAGESAGSMAYMSPEQLRGKSQWLDGRSDIWALGIIMYEMLSGRRPFGGQTPDDIASEIFVREPKPLRQIDASIPMELEQICFTCLSKAIGGRYATARDFADALRKTTSGPASAADNLSTTRQLLGNRDGVSWIGAALLGCALLGLVAIIFAIDRGSAKTPVSLTLENIELSVYSAADNYRGRINKTEASASPLRSGDKVRLAVVLSRPAYPYVFWIGTDGDVTPIYPWRPGDWTERPPELATDRLQLPLQPNETWQVQPGASGVETIVVVVADRPLPATLQFAKLFSTALPQTDISIPHPLWFDNGTLRPHDTTPFRSPAFTFTVPLDNSLITNQIVIGTHCSLTSSSCHALCVPITGGSS